MDNIQLNLTNDFKNKASRVPVKAIGLPTRALNILFANGVKNSCDAIYFVLNNLSESPRIGLKTVTESHAAVKKFILFIESASEKEIRKIIDCREEYLASANGNLAEAFPAILELYLSKNTRINQKRDGDIIRKRFGLSGSKKYTLEDIGTYYDITRERVRQIEATLIKDLSLLLNGSLKQKEWKICQKLINNHKDICTKINSLEWIALNKDIENIFLEKFGDSLSPEHTDLFMEVCGFVKLPQNIPGFRGSLSESWILSKNYKKSEIEAVFQALDIIYDSANSISTFDLTIAAKKKSKSSITNSSIKIALFATNDIDFDGENIKVKFSRLRSAADKAERILESHGKPVHFSKIAQEINLLNRETNASSHLKETNLKNQLVSDKRFMPIGKSGEWELTAWGNLNNITIIQAIEKVLHSSGKPLKFLEIEAEVSKIRPDASAKSLKVYLNDQPIFARVGRNEYALTAWRLKAAPKIIKKDSVPKKDLINAIQNSLEKSNPINLTDLISAVNAKTGLSFTSARQRILATKGLEISQKKNNNYKEVFCTNIETLSENIEEKISLRDRVQEEIKSILFESPNTSITKGSLYKEVLKNVACIRPTFYQYLDKMSDIHKYKDGNNYYVIYRHEEKVEKIHIDINKYTSDGNTKKLLERPLSLLTVSDVDIALFELGMIFESRLKQYLLLQKKQGVINVSAKDTSKLADMINCVVREGIITKGHHLGTLREERNNRAHGNPPSLQERHELFNKAHYIAELFVKYICFFN